MFFGLAVALTYSIVFKRPKHKLLAFPFLLLLFFSDNFIHSSGFYRFSKKEAKQRVENLSLHLSIGSQELLSYEPAFIYAPKAHYHLDAMLLAQSKDVKVVNGYTSTVPVGYYHFAESLNEEGRNIWFEAKGVKKEPIVISEQFSNEVNRIIKAIKGDSSWLNKVKEQAIQRGISLEENIIENAIWLETQNKEGRDVK